nr:MAG TPA: hypothetical protein [Caudoviricetes sp.]DAV08714.1 MAG TPA: hypothetical protein [Caudoviricetes sp.]
MRPDHLSGNKFRDIPKKIGQACLDNKKEFAYLRCSKIFE